MSCTANAGGHYYTRSVTSDPWVYATYAGGTTSFAIDTGASTLGQLNGHALIIHAYDGSPIACAILGAVSDESSALIIGASASSRATGMSTAATVLIVGALLTCLLVIGWRRAHPPAEKLVSPPSDTPSGVTISQHPDPEAAREAAEVASV